MKLEKQFPNVASKYGAPMGRPNHGEPTGRPVELFRVRAEDVAYDDGGAYWGDIVRSPLFCIRNDFCEHFVRAKTRGEAEAHFRSVFPDIEFEPEVRDMEVCIETTVRHFLIAAVWADCEEGTAPRVTAQARKEARVIVDRFLKRCAANSLYEKALDRIEQGYGLHADCGDIEPAAAAFGHDMWLSIRGHGAGFFDRKPLEEDGLGDKLQALARDFPEPEYEQHHGWFYLYA